MKHTKQVTADLTVWAVFLNAAYLFLIGMLALRNPRDMWKDVKATSWPALRSAWRFWPFVHTVSFSHAVPMDLKLLWVDMMEVVWVTILSKVNHKDKQAANKQEEAAAAAVASVSEGETIALPLEAVQVADEQEGGPMEQPSKTDVPLLQKVFMACYRYKIDRIKIISEKRLLLFVCENVDRKWYGLSTRLLIITPVY